MEAFVKKPSSFPGYDEDNGPIINHRLKKIFFQPAITEIIHQTLYTTEIRKPLTFNEFEEFIISFDQLNSLWEFDKSNLQGFINQFWQDIMLGHVSTMISSSGFGWISTFRGQKDENQKSLLMNWLGKCIKSKKGVECDLLNFLNLEDAAVSWFGGSTFSFQKWRQGPCGLGEIHYLHRFSSPRIWFGISPNSTQEVKKLLSDYDNKFMSVTDLTGLGIKITTVIQEPGTTLITAPGAFYAFLNSGFNVSESFVYCQIQWISIASKKFAEGQDTSSLLSKYTLEEIIFRLAFRFSKMRKRAFHIDHYCTLLGLIRTIASREDAKRREIMEFVSSKTEFTVESVTERNFCTVCKKFIYLSGMYCLNHQNHICLPCFDKEKHRCICKKEMKSLVYLDEISNVLKISGQIEKWVYQYHKWRKNVQKLLNDYACGKARGFSKSKSLIHLDKSCKSSKTNSSNCDSKIDGVMERTSDESTKNGVQLVSENRCEKDEELKMEPTINGTGPQAFCYEKPSLEEVKSVLSRATVKGFTSDVLYAELQSHYDRSCQFNSLLECFLHPELIKSENESLKSLSFEQPILSIPLDDLDVALRVGDTLMCHFKEIDKLHEINDSLKESREMCLKLMKNSLFDTDDEINKMKQSIQKSKTYPVYDEIFEKSEKTLQRHEWLRKVERILENSNSNPQSVQVWEDLLFTGRNLTIISDEVRTLYEEMSQKVDDAVLYNDRASTILNSCRGDSVKKTSARKIDSLLQKTKDVPILMPKVKSLRDVYEKVRQWIQEIDVPCESRQVYPFLSRLEKLCEEGDRLPLSLPQLPQLRTQVFAAQSWRDRVARFFMLKNGAATLTLLQALMPRSATSLMLEINNGRSAKRRRRGGHTSSAAVVAQAAEECSKRFLELVNAVDLRNEVSMDLTQERLLKIYKEMALAEYQAMLKLRQYNLEKAEKDDDDAVYCICKRTDGSGFMLQCDLCKEWYHGQCVSLPRKLQGKSTTRSESMQNAVKDMKYLCPCCERSRRPTLDSVLSLLLASQKLPVRLVEGAALECLAERAVQWQDNTQGFLVSTTEIAKAFSCYCKISNVQLPDNLMHQLRLKLTYPDVERPQTRSYLSSESGSHLHQLQSKMRAAMAACRIENPTPVNAPANPASSQTNYPGNQAHSTGLIANPRSNVLRTPSIGPSGMRKHMRKTPLLPRSDSIEGHGLDTLSHSSSIGSVSGTNSMSSSPPHIMSTNIAHGTSVTVSSSYGNQMPSPMMRGHINQNNGPPTPFSPISSRPQMMTSCTATTPPLQLSREARREMEDKLLEGDLIELQMDEKSWLWDMLCLSSTPIPPTQVASPINNSSVSGCISSDPPETPTLPAPVIAHSRVSGGSSVPPAPVISSNERPCVAPRVKAEKEERLKRQRLQQWDLEQHGIAYSSSSSDSEMNIRLPLYCRKSSNDQDEGDVIEEDYDSDASTNSNVSPRRKVISFYRQGGVARPVFGKRRSSSSDSSFDIEKQVPSRSAPRRKENPATVAYRAPRMNHGASRLKKSTVPQQMQHHPIRPQIVKQQYSTYHSQTISKGYSSNATAQCNIRLKDPMSPPTNPPPRRKRKVIASSSQSTGKSTSSGHGSGSKRRMVQNTKTASSDEDSSSGGEAGDYASGVCSVAFCERPNAKVVQWIQCDKCEKWYHFQCIGLRNKTDAGRTFICLRCKQKEANAHDNFYYGRR